MHRILAPLLLFGCWHAAVALDLDALEISGNQTFTAGSIRSALRLDPSVDKARRAGLPDWKVFQLVCDRVRIGYLRHGFADAGVQPDYDRGMAIAITEGPRYTWRTLTLDAPAEVDADRIRLAIVDPPPRTVKNREADGQSTQPLYREERPDPLWTDGETARCDGYFTAQLERRVRDCCLEELGIDAEIEVDQQMLDAAGVGTKITIRPRTDLPVVAEIRLPGLERNPPADVERWVREVCGLARGEPASEVALHVLRRRLEDSGRCVAFRADYRPLPGDDGVALVLHLVEDETLPLLGAELTPLQDLCFALRNRTRLLLDHPDLHATVAGTGVVDGVHGRIRGVYRQGGLHLHTGWRRGEDGEELTWGCRLTADGYALWSGHDRHLLRGTLPALSFQSQVTYTTHPDPEGQISRLQIGTQFTTRQGDSRPLLVRMSPAAFLAIAGRIVRDGTAFELTEDDAGTTLTGPDWTLFLGSGADRQLRVTLADEERDARWELTAALRPGDGLPALPGGEGWREDRVDEHAVMHLLGFAHRTLTRIVAAELLPADGSEPVRRWLDRAGGAWIWLAAAADTYLELARAAHDADKDTGDAEREDFSIPFDPREIESSRQMQRMVAQMREGFDHLMIWRPGSWPDRLLNLSFDTLTGDRQRIISNLTALQADAELGPWGNLAATMAAKQLEHPIGGFFARRAADRLDADAAWRDLLDLSCGPEPLVTWLLAVEPIPEAVAPFPLPQRNAVAAMLQALHDAPDDEARHKLVRKLFAVAWDARLRDLTAGLIEAASERKVEIP